MIMVINVFNRAAPWATQEEICRYFIDKLKAVHVAELTTSNYSSSSALAGMVAAMDEDNRVELIEVYHSFVRIKRNETGRLPFGATIVDYVRYPKLYQDEYFRP